MMNNTGMQSGGKRIPTVRSQGRGSVVRLLCVLTVMLGIAVFREDGGNICLAKTEKMTEAAPRTAEMTKHSEDPTGRGRLCIHADTRACGLRLRIYRIATFSEKGEEYGTLLPEEAYLAAAGELDILKTSSGERKAQTELRELFSHLNQLIAGQPPTYELVIDGQGLAQAEVENGIYYITPEANSRYTMESCMGVLPAYDPEEGEGLRLCNLYPKICEIKGPRTGDHTVPLLWTGAMFTAGSFLVGSCILWKKRRM